MDANRFHGLSRRRFLAASAGLSLPLLSRYAQAGSDGDYRLTATAARAQLVAGKPPTAVWSYDSRIPGPVLRLAQGKPVRIIVANELSQDTTVHWHGIRLANAMDGVPGLTQPPITPGSSFVYDFTPPDAGTFWYHPHANSLEQLGRGLAGALIIEETGPVRVDRDLVWMLSDWRLNDKSEIDAGFGNRMEAAMSGHVGNTVTVNGATPAAEPVRAAERIRLRLVNTSLARIMALRFEGHRPVIVAVDGQPCTPHEPENGRILLAPAMRIDVMMDMEGEPGRHYGVIDDFYDGLSYALARFVYDLAPPVRAHPLDAAMALPRNPLPEPDLATATRYAVELQGGMMGGGAMTGMGGMANHGMNAGALWAINGASMTGDGHAGMQPLATFARGRSVIMTMRNQTAWWHPMHLHGHSFKLVSRNGKPVPFEQWNDTVLLAPKDSVDCAFVADNPGDWMLHCHVTDHQMTGLMTVFRVA